MCPHTRIFDELHSRSEGARGRFAGPKALETPTNTNEQSRQLGGALAGEQNVLYDLGQNDADEKNMFTLLIVW